MTLGLAVCAVVAGARSFTAIAEWAADADQDTLRALGVSGAVPSESNEVSAGRERRAVPRWMASRLRTVVGVTVRASIRMRWSRSIRPASRALIGV